MRSQDRDSLQLSSTCQGNLSPIGKRITLRPLEYEAISVGADMLVIHLRLLQRLAQLEALLRSKLGIFLRRFDLEFSLLDACYDVSIALFPGRLLPSLSIFRDLLYMIFGLLRSVFGPFDSILIRLPGSLRVLLLHNPNGLV